MRMFPSQESGVGTRFCLQMEDFRSSFSFMYVRAHRVTCRSRTIEKLNFKPSCRRDFSWPWCIAEAVQACVVTYLRYGSEVFDADDREWILVETLLEKIHTKLPREWDTIDNLLTYIFVARDSWVTGSEGWGSQRRIVEKGLRKRAEGFVVTIWSKHCQKTLVGSG